MSTNTHTLQCLYCGIIMFNIWQNSKTIVSSRGREKFHIFVSEKTLYAKKIQMPRWTLALLSSLLLILLLFDVDDHHYYYFLVVAILASRRRPKINVWCCNMGIHIFIIINTFAYTIDINIIILLLLGINSPVNFIEIQVLLIHDQLPTRVKFQQIFD